MKHLTTKLVVASGCLAVSLTTGLAVASAQPDYSPLINTNCDYGRAVEALRVQRPDLYQQFMGAPMAQSLLQRFLASSPDQRAQIVQQNQGNPLAQRYQQDMLLVASTC